MKYTKLLICSVALAFTACTDNTTEGDFIEGAAMYDTIPRQQLTEEMQVWEVVDSSRVIIVR